MVTPHTTACVCERRIRSHLRINASQSPQRTVRSARSGCSLLRRPPVLSILRSGRSVACVGLLWLPPVSERPYEYVLHEYMQCLYANLCAYFMLRASASASEAQLQCNVHGILYGQPCPFKCSTAKFHLGVREWRESVRNRHS